MICWRDVPTENSILGQVAKKCEPYMRQVFVTGDQEVEALNRQVNITRTHGMPNYIPTLRVTPLLFRLFIRSQTFLFVVCWHTSIIGLPCTRVNTGQGQILAPFEPNNLAPCRLASYNSETPRFFMPRVLRRLPLSRFRNTPTFEF